MSKEQVVKIIDTVRTSIENISYPDTINVVVKEIQKIGFSSQDVAAWLTAVGTLGTVAIAIMLPIIKKLYNRPIMNFCFDFDSDSDEESKFNSEYVVKKTGAEENDLSIDIFIGIENNGRSVPEYPSAYICSYSIISHDGREIKKKIKSIKLKNKKGEEKIEYTPKGEVFLKVACIKKDKGNSSGFAGQGASAVPENIYKVYLCGEEEIEIGNGQFCIPITFTSANAKKTTMLKILWDHTNWDVSSAKFCVNKIEEQRMEIKRMIVEILRNVIIGGV